jgi:hypothetical protein
MSSQTPPFQSRTLWDYIRDGISTVTSTAPVQGLGSGLSGLGSLASIPFQNRPGQAIVGTAKSIGRTFAGKGADFFGALGETEGETLKGEPFRKGFSEKLLPDTIGGYTATPAERKKASEKIAKGRAFYTALDVYGDRILGRNINSKISPDAYDPETGLLYNVYDKAQREERYDKLGFTGNLVTGLFDFTTGVNPFLSPAIALGSISRALRKLSIDKPLTTERSVAKKDLDTLTKAEAERTEFFNAKNKLNELENENLSLTGRTADEVIAERKALEAQLPKLEAKADKAADELSKIGYANGLEEFLKQSTILNSEQLLKHRTVNESSNPDLLAGLLGENKDLYQAGLIVRAVSGDLSASRLLAAESTSTFMALQRALKPLGELEMDIKAYKQADGDVHKLSLMEENFDILKAEVDDLVKKDSFLQRAVQAAEEKVLEGRGGSSMFRTVEQFRAGKARVFGEASTVRNWDVQYFKRNPFVATVAVVSWPFREKPANWVRVKGIDTGDSVREVEAFMQGVSPWKGIEGANIRASYLRRYAQAANQIERETVVDAMQNAAVTSVGAKYGLTKKQVDEIIEKWKNAKANAVEHYQKKGYLIDENNTIVKVPQLSSQLADSVPLIDIIALDRKLKSISKSDKDIWKTAAKAGNNVVVKPLEILDELWRPAVLFRLGYPIRNVTEGQGRFIAYMGPATSVSTGLSMLRVKPIVVNNKVVDVDGVLPRWLKNRHAGLIDHFTLLRAQNEARSTGRIINGISPTDLIAPKRVSWNRVIQFQEDSIVLNMGKIEALEETLKTLRKDKAKPHKMQGIIDEIAVRKEFDIEATARLKKYTAAASKKGIKGNRYSVGQGYFSYKGYEDIPLTFQDDAGEVLKQLTSSASTKSRELRSANRVYAGFDSSRFVVDDFVELHPGDSKYFVGLARAVNRQFRNSEVMIRLLRGDTVDKVVEYLKTQKGTQELRLTKYTDPEEYATKMQIAVERYIPDPALRLRLSKEQVTAPELQAILGKRKDLQSIHGDSFKEIPDLSNYEKYQQAVRNAFRFIGSLPEDALVRHPFADAVYQAAIKESIDNAKKQGLRFTDAEFNKIVVGARRKALSETRRYMYTIERNSNAANLTRFIEPFFMSAQNTAQVWSRLVYKDPRLIGAAGYIYMSPERAGLLQTDVNDREIVVMQIPDWMRKGWMKKALEGQEAISFEKGGANLIAQGTDWWRLGDGFVGGIAASELLKKYPDSKWTPIYNYFAPFGASRVPGSIDMYSPTIPKRILSAIRGTSDRQYNNFFITATRVEEQKYNLGLRDEPSLQEVEERVNAFVWLWAGSSAITGVAFKFRPEYQFYIDEARKYREKYGIDAALYFYQDHPDYFDLFFSISRNPSNMEPTKAAITFKKKYQNLVDQVPQKYPEFTQLITNSYGSSEGDFDNNAYTWQILNELRTGDKTKIRQAQSATEVAKTNNISRGWAEYGVFMDKRDAALQNLMRVDPSVTSIYSKNASGLREDKRLWVESMKEKNLDWWDEFGTFSTRRSYRFVKFAETLMKDKKFMAERGQAPVWDAMNEYMKSRKQLVTLLKIRQATGGSANIDAKSNADLAADWGAAIELMKKTDLTGTFSSFYNRFLDSDTFEEIK